MNQEIQATPVVAVKYDAGGSQPKQTIIVDNSGDKLFTTIYPNAGKQTILLLHGGPGFPDDLVEVAAVLKDRFQVVTFHQRGTGASPCSSNDYSMDAYISDVEAIRKYFDINRFHLWGHSWGGLYAQIYAQQHGENLLSLFLCCPGSGTGSEWQQTEREVMQLNRSKCTPRQWAKMGWNNLLGMLGSNSAYARLFTQVMHNYNDDFMGTNGAGKNFDLLRAAPINKTRPQILKYPLLQRQPAPHFKITIVYGDRDIYSASKNFVLHRYPTATVHWINNCGHIPWLHNPVDYATVLQQHYDMIAK
ncbi:alpha/beta fold hydrolase [Paracnuella aquatica]|uniref:alpha/beta fold hydrolase n=1 Tax=Paracnuella aquatica TaxID=2268757 RepID=UPI000DEFF8D9|nr:alpha/beta hydrolase [Paracnuella aquatica]RPD50675.1 alpha/beta hydrolase [Paracnuella aquatica]